MSTLSMITVQTEGSTMNGSDDPIPLSALQHWAYCPRQYAPIHLEQLFEDNLYTQRDPGSPCARGPGRRRLRPGLRVEQTLPL